jgi:hypothetical protein
MATPPNDVITSVPVSRKQETDPAPSTNSLLQELEALKRECDLLQNKCELYDEMVKGSHLAHDDLLKKNDSVIAEASEILHE